MLKGDRERVPLRGIGLARDMQRSTAERRDRKLKPSNVLGLSGASQEVPMFWVFVTFLWAAMLLSPFVLLYLFLPAGRNCPRCASETVAVRSSLLHPLRRVAALRWCLSCGWEGIARSTVLRRALPRFEVVPDSKDDVDEAPWRGV